MSYRVKTVCSMLGIPRPTLLAWERRYQLTPPERAENGHRLYSERDVAVLRQLKELVDRGHSIGEAVRLQRGTSAAADASDRPLPEMLLEALRQYDRAWCDRLMPRVRALSFAEALDSVYLPLLRATGDAWERGELSVAQEHFVSGWCREQMFSLFHGLNGGPAAGPTAVCALAPHETHELGLLAVAIHLMLAGWRVTWLGADLPIEELCTYIREERPRLVCFSSVFGPGPDQVQAWAQQIRAAAPPETAVALGGPSAAAVRLPGVVFAERTPDLLRHVQGWGRT